MADKSWNWIDLVNTALAGYQAYHNTRPPDFKNPGMTPEQQQLYQLFFKSLTNPALVNNAGDVSNYGRSILGGYSNLGWQAPKTTTGETGYPGHGPVNFDWSKLTAPAGSTTPQTPPGPTGTVPSNGVPGDPFGHQSAPVGGPGDPFAWWPNTQGQNGGGGISEFLEQHPGIFANGVAGAAGVLASMLGIPPGIASTLVSKFLASRGQQPTDYDPYGLKTDNPNVPYRKIPDSAWQPPGQYDMRPPAPVNYTSRDPGKMYDPGRGISGGIVQPEGQGHGQGGFGYGWGYDQFYGGGNPAAILGAPGWGSPFGRMGGQRV